MHPAFAHSSAAAAGLLAGLAACAPQDGADAARTGFHPRYMGAESIALADDLMLFQVTMKGARNADDVTDYARCIAAGNALRKGFGFARHVQTNVNEKGGVWRADAVYTISPALPGGLRTIDAQVTVADCADEGIPTV